MYINAWVWVDSAIRYIDLNISRRTMDHCECGATVLTLSQLEIRTIRRACPSKSKRNHEERSLCVLQSDKPLLYMNPSHFSPLPAVCSLWSALPQSSPRVTSTYAEWSEPKRYLLAQAIDLVIEVGLLLLSRPLSVACKCDLSLTCVI